MFNSNEELFLATNNLISSLKRNGHNAEADALNRGLSSINSLTDGWAIFLDEVKKIDWHAKRLLGEPDCKIIGEIHNAAYKAVYRRDRRPWWKFWYQSVS